MSFLLDTDVCVVLLRKRPQALLARLTALDPGDVGISSVTASELHYGIQKSLHRERNVEALAHILAAIEIHPFGAAEAEAHGRLRAELERSGRGIGVFDAMIAAHALTLGATMVTGNVREFGRVPGLRIENWLR